MDDKTQEMLDRALGELARDVADGSPRPSADLVARVLAGAAAATPAPTPARTAPAPRARLMDYFFGWGGGAVATLCLCLALGIGVGLTLDPADMPGFEDPGQEIALTMDGGLLSDGVL